MLSPDLSFKGQCNDAIALYKEVFGAELKFKQLYAEAKPEDFQYQDEAEKSYIFHAQMMFGDQLIFMADDSNGIVKMGAGKRNMNLCVEFDTEEKVEAAYRKIAMGAEILVPMTPTTYSTHYVQLIDKFGIQWELMGPEIGEIKWSNMN
jgi:PhnB protein